MRTGSRRKLIQRRAPSWARDERGGTAIHIAITAAVVLGVGGLAMDMGRLVTLNTEMQKFADAAALRAAAELDGKAGAIARATAAANGVDLGVNRNSFAKEGAALAVDSLQFLSALDPDVVAASDTMARFVKVMVAERKVENWFITVVGGPASSATQASAVAGFARAVCRVPPLFMCNPSESQINPGVPMDWTNLPGKQVLLKAQANNGNIQHGSGNGAAWAPGDFGLLQSPAGNGNAVIAEQLGTNQPYGCYDGDVDLAPGQKSVSQGFNVRFDMFDQSFKHRSDEAQFVPSLTVVKGLRRQGNNWVEDASYAKLGRDSCFATSSCAANNRLGNGVWGFTAYWNTNHRAQNGTPLPVPPQLAGNPTRYAVYRYEMEFNQVPYPPQAGNPAPRSTGENGHPVTYNGPPPTLTCAAYPNPSDPNCDTPEEVYDNYDRRLLIVAVINCVANAASMGGSANGVPVESYAQVFITEPMKDDNGNSNKEVWAEMVGPVAAGSILEKAVFKDTVQLYR
jgi:Putative Flp pilus-assembly TadE/G-like